MWYSAGHLAHRDAANRCSSTAPVIHCHCRAVGGGQPGAIEETVCLCVSWAEGARTTEAVVLTLGASASPFIPSDRAWALFESSQKILTRSSVVANRVGDKQIYKPECPSYYVFRPILVSAK